MGIYSKNLVFTQSPVPSPQSPVPSPQSPKKSCPEKLMTIADQVG
ncbi:hypothetical protein [Sphaerospermopsis reniformis]|nr:hypothetical protein [Sphaerospermopsis reniformis]